MKNIPFLAQLRNYNEALLGAGFLLLAAGILSVLIVDTTNWWNIALVVVGVILLGFFLAANLAQVKAAGKKRSNLAQANLTMVALAMFGIVGGLNYVVSRHPIRFDLTSGKIYTLADQTVDTLKKLPQDVTVTMFTSARRSSDEIEKAVELLTEYGKKSTKFHFRTVDVEKNPAEVKRMGITEANEIVFECGEKRKDVLQRDYITYPMTSMQSRPQPKFQGEEAFTAALLTVTDPTQLTVYFTQGHGEKDLNDPQGTGLNFFNTALGQENYATKTLNLLTSPKVPGDASVVAVIGPQSPFQVAEAKALEDYLKAGGKMVICVDPLDRSGRAFFNHTGLEAIFKDYGVKLGDDVAVDPTNYVPPNPQVVVPQYLNHPIVAKLSSDHVFTLIPLSRSVQQVEPALKNATRDIFLETTDKGWGVVNLKEKKLVYHPGLDTKGPVPLAEACEWTPTEGPAAGKKSRLVVFGNSNFLANQVVQQAGNEDLGLNAFSWAVEQENKITIHPKEEAARPITLTNVSAHLVFYLVVFILPLIVLLAGGWIWYRRRSL